MRKPFTWWWPSSTGGAVAFWIAILLPGLTIFVAGLMGIINVAFWYLVAVGIRFVFIKANGTGPSSATHAAPPSEIVSTPQEREDGMGPMARFVFAVLLPIALILLVVVALKWDTAVFDATPTPVSH
jgi:hypothetical protein